MALRRLRRLLRESPRSRPSHLTAEQESLAPLLWPRGVVKTSAPPSLHAIAEHYGQTGRTLAELFEDLQAAYDHKGVKTSGWFVETVASAWADAYLELQNTQSAHQSEPFHLVRERLSDYCTSSGGLPEPRSGALLIITRSSQSSSRASAQNPTHALLARLHSRFPDGVFEVSLDARTVVGVIPSRADTERHLNQLRADIGAHPTWLVTSLRTQPLPRGLDAANDLVSEAG